MILLDTSALIECLTGHPRYSPALRQAGDRGELIALTTIVLFEWLRGPRSPRELAAQEAILPSASAKAFGSVEAVKAAELYRTVRAPRRRELDLAIAACALCWDARLWTVNLKDFDDIPGLAVSVPS